VRVSAAYALGRLGKAEPGVVEGLLGLLGDEDQNVRWRAAYALGVLGKAEPGVVEGLLGLLDDEDEDVRGSAALALDLRIWLPDQGIQRIPSHVMPALSNLLTDEREAQHPFLETRNKVKDVAWRLLQRYSEETGERIYGDDGGE